MRPPFHSSIARIGVRPDQPGAVVGPRPRGSRRPHADATVAVVRRLIEDTTLTYGEIAAKTGVGCASICRWARDGGWRRPLFAPRATDTVPSARASARLKARTLAARLFALADRAIRELEASASVDLDALAEALELLKMARLAARPKRRRPGANAGAAGDAAAAHSPPGPEHFARAAMRELRAGGVSIERAPEAALEDFIASRAPPPERQRPRRRSRRSDRNRAHAWLLEK